MCLLRFEAVGCSLWLLVAVRKLSAAGVMCLMRSEAAGCSLWSLVPAWKLWILDCGRGSWALGVCVMCLSRSEAVGRSLWAPV